MNNLGKNGRIGNQMFQYAALVGIAKNKGYDFRIPENQELSKCFEMLHCGNRYGHIDGDEVELHDSHEFCKELFDECPNHITLNGYFQSEKYFQNAKKLLRWDFRFKPETIKEVDEIYGDVLNKNPISVVVRDYNDTFDYPNCSYNHLNLPFSYFKKGLKILGEDRPVIICSNNIELCKLQKEFSKDNFIFVDNKTKSPKAHFDLCLISKCKDFIISNSTFSWWGAYLGGHKNKRVLCPNKWYGEGLSHISTQDLLPEDWEIIKL